MKHTLLVYDTELKVDIMKKMKMADRLKIVEKNGDVFIYNTVFGNLYRTDRDTLKFLQSFSEPKLVDENEQPIKNLRERVFLVEEGKNEYSMLKDGHEKFIKNLKEGKFLRKLQLMVSTRCNLQCTHCYEARTGPADAEEGNMDFSVAKKALTNFFDIVNNTGQEKVFIRYFGGEPLRNWKVVKDSSEYIKELETKPEVVQAINTNGTLVTNEIAKYLGENRFDVDLSLEAPNELNDKIRVYRGGRGTFKDVDEKIDVLIRHNVNPEISAQLNDYNINHLDDFVDYLKNKGVKKFEVNTLICDNNNLCSAPVSEKVKKLVELKRYAENQGVHLAGKWIRLYNHTLDGTLNYCSRQGEQLSVNPSGDVFSCSGLSIKLGTIDDMRSILSSKEYEEMSMRIVGNIPGCRNCEVEGMCVGGCRASGIYSGNNEKYAPEFGECEFRKEIVNAQIGDKIEREDPAYKSLTARHFTVR